MPRPSGRKSSRRKPLQHPLAAPPIYSAVRAMAATANIAGIDQSLRAMRGLGGCWAGMPLNRSRLRRAVDNISWCFPMWDEDRVHACAVEAYRHLFALASELALTPRLLNQDGYAAYVELGDLSQALRTMCGDKPCILITGHCGNWELLGYTLALLGFPVHALYRPLDVKSLDQWVFATRQRRGLTLIDKFGAARTMPMLLSRNEAIGFIADQNAGPRGMFVPFFDRLASSYKAIGVLAARYDAPVVCGHARRMSGFDPNEQFEPEDGLARAITCQSQLFKYHLDVVDVIRPEDWRDQPDPVFYITARYRRAIEAMVRRAPEQYLWMHRYWKSRPIHERTGRPFPGALREKIASLPWMTDERIERIVRRSEEDGKAYRASH